MRMSDRDRASVHADVHDKEYAMGPYGQLITGLIVVCVSMTLVTCEEDATARGRHREEVESPKSVYPYYCVRCTCIYINGTPDLMTNCTGYGLYLPIYKKTAHLILQSINLYRIKSYYFRGLENLTILDLSNNRIASIHINAFSDLHNLKELYLHNNNFRTMMSALQPGVFSSLASLTVLTLHGTIDSSLAYTVPIESQTFANLTSLEFLSVGGTNMIEFDEGFKKLENLKTVVISGDDGACQINNLTKTTFIGLESLQNLTLTNCDIKTIDRETFSPLRNLRYLDLSRNTELEIPKFGEAAYGLTFTNLSVLKINSIHNPLRAGTELLKDYMVYFVDLPLTELYMDENGIEYVALGVFSRLPPSMKYLSLRRNKLTFSLYINEAVFNNPSLHVIDAADQSTAFRTYPSPRIVKKYRDNLEGKKVLSHSIEEGAIPEDDSVVRKKRDTSEPVRLSLQKLVCTGSMSNIALINFTSTINNISYMDLSQNFIPMLKGYEFLGLPKLRYLNLSSNYIEIVIDRTGFRELIHLEVLDLHDNLLGKELEQNTAMFSHLGRLIHLNLSMNRVYKLGNVAFKGLYSLETLDLSENYLSEFDVDLSDLASLYKLNLANNGLRSLLAKTRKSLDEKAKTREVKLDLRGNELSCNCETIPFLRWLVETPVVVIDLDQYQCLLNNASIRYLNATESIVYNLEEECRSYLVITVVSATGGSFLIALFLCYFIYRNRWKIRYLYYMAKIKIDGHKEENMDAHFDFDVFLSYADPDRTFVVKEMVPNLEQKEGIRLCIRDRDFDIGEVVAVNISKAIRTSKRTLLLVDRHFLKNKWCNFEMNMARMEAIHMKRKVLVIVFLEAVPANALPLELIDILREYPNTDVPENEELKPAFWQTCMGFVKE